MTSSSNSNSYGSIQLGGSERNVESLGALIAWLVINNLFESHLERSAGSSVTRVRLHDLTGPEFLTTILHGELKPSHLNSAGQQFIESYFVSGKYDTDYAQCDYAGENEWTRYAEVSPRITAAFRAHARPKSSIRSLGAKILKFPQRS
ncbi:MAG: hypothetical protein KUG75_02265 [Pseudomonadales bacterium]|nr:hypothetical protein [Pseudomonadales bacterium]